MPLEPGGGYVSAYAPSVELAYQWLQERDIKYEIIELYGKAILWIPLLTPDYGVGEGYYALAIVTESLDDTLDRIEIRTGLDVQSKWRH